MGLNINLLEQKLFQLDEYLQLLNRYKQIPFTEFQRNPDYYGAGERFLQVSIEICLDIGNHIIGKSRWEKPESYSEIFRILEEKNVLSHSTKEFMIRTARFRNLLVHHYFKIDKKQVHDIIKDNLHDLKLFSKEIFLFIQNNKSEGKD